MSRSKLWRDCKGVAALEFALIAPLFISILVIGTDLVFLIQNNFRIEQAAIQGMQVVTQFTTLYDDDFTKTLFPVIKTIAGNGSSDTDANQVACGATISGLDYPVSGVRKGLLSIVWQKTYMASGAGACNANKIGTFDNATGLPVAPSLSNYTPPAGVPFIVVEVASLYSLLGQSAALLGATRSQYSSTMGMPRQRVLPPITPGNRP